MFRLLHDYWKLKELKELAHSARFGKFFALKAKRQAERKDNSIVAEWPS